MRFARPNAPQFERSFSPGPGIISPFIKIAIIVNVLIFLLEQFSRTSITHLFGLTPSLFLSEFPQYIYQPITYMFLHGNFWHIFFNMFALWMFGTEIEYNFGTRRFAWFYMLSGLAGAALTLAFRYDQIIPTVGASGAIYGVLIAYWISFPERYLYLYFLLPIKVKWAIPGLMIIGYFTGGPGVAHFAHLGGALFGLVYMKLDWRLPSLGKRLKTLRYEQQERKLQRNREQAEDVMRRVDAILDRINEVGIENLTPEERKFLEKASTDLAKRKNEKTQS